MNLYLNTHKWDINGYIKERYHFQGSSSSDTYKATFFSLSSKEGKDRIEELLKKDPSIVVHDEIDGQLRELIKA